MMFVMDGSASISNDEGVELVQFVVDVVNLLGDVGGNDIVYGSVVFARDAKLQVSLADQKDAQDFINDVALDRSGLGGTTNTHKGIDLAMQNILD
jgi:hypothetical protein